jgi:hypothetical protein
VSPPAPRETTPAEAIPPRWLGHCVIATLPDGSAGRPYRSARADFRWCVASSAVSGCGHRLTTEAEAPLAAGIMLRWVSQTARASHSRSGCAVTGSVALADR